MPDGSTAELARELEEKLTACEDALDSAARYVDRLTGDPAVGDAEFWKRFEGTLSKVSAISERAKELREKLSQIKGRNAPGS